MRDESMKIAGRGVAIISVGWFAGMLANLSVFSLGMMLQDIMKDLGFGLSQAGTLSAASWIVKALITIPIALMVSRINPKMILIALYLLVGIGMVVQATAPNYWLLLLGRCLVAGASAGVFVPLVPVKINWIPKERMAQMNGIESFIGPVGQSFGTVAVTYFMKWFDGWRPVMLALGIVGIAVAVVWFFVYREREGAEFKRSNAPILAPLKEAMSHRTVRMITLSWPSVTIPWIAFFTFWPAFASAQYGFTREQCALILGVYPIASAVGALVSPFWAKKLSKDKHMIWPWGFVLPLMFLGMVFVNQVWLLIVISIIAGFASYAFVPMAFTAMYKIPGISPRAVTMAVSVALTTVGLGGALGGKLAGNLGASMGLMPALIICSLTPIIFGVTTLFLPEAKKGEKPAQG